METTNNTQIKNTIPIMTSSIIIPQFFSLIKKAVFFKEGALVFLSAPFAMITQWLYQVISPDIPKQEILNPLITYGTLLLLYILVSIIDFYTGVRASKHEYKLETGKDKGYLQSAKLWSSIWKFTGVILISTIITTFTLLFLILHLTWFYNVFLLGIFAFFFTVIFFDIHSIGENIERKYGNRPKFYVIVDNITTAIHEGIIRVINNKLK